MDRSENGQFGRRIKELIDGKGWTQSDLARVSSLPRDSISVYVRGKSLPLPDSLAKLCNALGVKPEDLLPSAVDDPYLTSSVSFQLTVTSQESQTAWIRLDRSLPIEIAPKIYELVKEADEPTANF